MGHVNTVRAAILSGFICACLSATLSANETLTSSSFISKAGRAGIAEVELGKIAAKKSADPAVRAFAEKMAKDHLALNMQLDAAARTASMRAPTQLDSGHRAVIDAINAKSGAEFDAEYVSHVATAHAEAIALFQTAAETDHMSDGLKRFAKANLPTLEDYKAMADSLAATVQVSGAVSN